MKWLFFKLFHLPLVDRWMMSRHPYPWSECYHTAGYWISINSLIGIFMAFLAFKLPIHIDWWPALIVIALAAYSFIDWRSAASSRAAENSLPPPENKKAWGRALADGAASVGLLTVPLLVHWNAAFLIAKIAYDDPAPLLYRDALVEKAWRLWYLGARHRVSLLIPPEIEHTPDEPPPGIRYIPDGFSGAGWDGRYNGEDLEKIGHLLRQSSLIREIFQPVDKKQEHPIIWNLGDEIRLETWGQFKTILEGIGLKIMEDTNHTRDSSPYGPQISSAALDQLAAILNEELSRVGDHQLPRAEELIFEESLKNTLETPTQLPGWRRLKLHYYSHQTAYWYTRGMPAPLIYLMMLMSLLAYAILTPSLGIPGDTGIVWHYILVGLSIWWSAILGLIFNQEYGVGELGALCFDLAAISLVIAILALILRSRTPFFTIPFGVLLSILWFSPESVLPYIALVAWCFLANALGRPRALSYSLRPSRT